MQNTGRISLVNPKFTDQIRLFMAENTTMG